MFYHDGFSSRVKKALQDGVLQNNLDTFYHNYIEAHRKAYEGLSFDKLRKEVSLIKHKPQEEIMELFELFRENVKKTGATVYRARDSKDACDYIVNVCKKHNAEYVVKSKSMTAEEIGLNRALEEAGIKPVETDLGEWIIQLAGETPSHMIMPAIHKNRKQVSHLFREHLGIDVDENDIEGMVKIARKHLREFYFKATVGISGANVAVAETGTIGIVTNEGNGRLTTSIPPVHIVVLGYEKLVRNFGEALKILRVLPKNATGQVISVYVSWIKGAIESIKAGGKKELHFVFVDNGRLAYLNNPILKEAFKCIRCGSCANVCPVYGVVGGHVFGGVYTGPIGVILTSMYHPSEETKRLLSLCAGCKTCNSICPAQVDIQGLIEKINAGFTERYGMNPAKKMLFSKVLTKPTNMKTVAKIGSIITKSKTIGRVIPDEHNFRELPSLSGESFTSRFKKEIKNPKNPIRRVFFYPGCAIEYIYPEIGIAMAKLLTRLNVAVDIPPVSVCCGLPAMHAGDEKSAKASALGALKHMGLPDLYDNYIVLCPTCGSTIKKLFGELTANLPHAYRKSRSIVSKLLMLSNFIESLNVNLRIKDNLKVTYHTPCHQVRGLGFSAEDFLKNILGEHFLKLRDSDRCCGFGGSFSIDHPGVSAAILEKKIENIKESGADILVTECPGCIIQIKGGILRKGLSVQVMHIAELLESYIDFEA